MYKVVEGLVQAIPPNEFLKPSRRKTPSKSEKKNQSCDYTKNILDWHISKNKKVGAQWLSGRVLDSRPRGRGVEPHWVVVLEQDTFILA